MLIPNEIEIEIREIFESEKYYGRELSNAEVEEIAENLANFAEVVVDYVKSK